MQFRFKVSAIGLKATNQKVMEILARGNVDEKELKDILQVRRGFLTTGVRQKEVKVPSHHPFDARSLLSAVLISFCILKAKTLNLLDEHC